MTTLADPLSSPDRIDPALPVVPGIAYRMFGDEGDFARLAELASRCNEHDDIPWVPTENTLRAELATASMTPAHDVLMVDVDGALVASTSVERTVRDGVPVYDMLGWVRPEYRRRGIGAALLDWSVRRIRQRATREDPGAQVQVQAGAEEQEVGHRALLASAGFVPVRHFFLMRRASLHDVPDIPLPDGIEIRPAQAHQLRTILTAEFEAFEDHWGNRELTEDSYRRTLDRPELRPDLWVVAWDGDEVAGVVENWIWAEENDQLGIRRGWLERISVRRPWRRRGLARAITPRALVRLRDAGMDEATLGVDSQNQNGALGLYEGLGFAVYRRAAAYRRPLDG